MDQKEVQQIKEHLQSKPTEELKIIYEKNDTNDYRPEAFEAIREILHERGIYTETLDLKQKKPVSLEETVSSVIIKDISMPFLSMVIFMIKWGIASIPAALIFFLIIALLLSFFGITLFGAL